MKFGTLACSALLVLATASFAQAQDLAPGEAAPPQDCVLDPELGPPADEKEREPSLQALTPCEGVIRPPRVGDSELVTPPPDVGTTPVIPPRLLPEQPGQREPE
ncbi:hypothetical protein [Rhodoligotrophos defluvii]|uniref:hypothetical protein n=1 Tax=Rhodoligotrophos defluvii TaxID=2561934 RepID=UPI0010C959C2|nr:hypothetical protein [Rhodoligotrophos defluvii]